MPGNGAMRYLITFESGRDVIVAQPGRIKPLFQSRNGAVMTVISAVPNTPERRDFVESGSFAGFERQTGVRSH